MRIIAIILIIFCLNSCSKLESEFSYQCDCNFDGKWENNKKEWVIHGVHAEFEGKIYTFTRTVDSAYINNKAYYIEYCTESKILLENDETTYKLSRVK